MKKNIKLAGIFAASALTLAFSGCSNDSQEQNALFRYNELNAKASLLSENRYQESCRILEQTLIILLTLLFLQKVFFKWIIKFTAKILQNIKK